MNERFWLKEFDLDLGAPLGEKYLQNGLWQRDFEKAKVLVNPSDNSLVFEFSEELYFANGGRAESPLILHPGSAEILFRKGEW